MAGLEGMEFCEFQMVRRIGGGGVGDVYLAWQPKLQRNVAIKVLRHEVEPLAGTGALSDQFIQEARLVAGLEHPHILPLYDFGECDGRHYLVMPYVPEGSLADLLGSGERHRLDLPVPPLLTAQLIDQAASALAYAHGHGIIHRDVKPHNLLVRLLPVAVASTPLSALTPASALTPGAQGAQGAQVDMHLLLADFGLARLLSGVTSQTRTTGTPLYTAPEQYSGQPVYATDQYALACVAYLLLTGHPVFNGTQEELYHQHFTVAPRPPSHLNHSLPPAVDAVLIRALAKAHTQRFASVQEFAQVLHHAVDPTARVGSSMPASGPWARPAVPSAALRTPAAGAPGLGGYYASEQGAGLTPRSAATPGTSGWPTAQQTPYSAGLTPQIERRTAPPPSRPDAEPTIPAGSDRMRRLVADLRDRLPDWNHHRLWYVAASVVLVALLATGTLLKTLGHSNSDAGLTRVTRQVTDGGFIDETTLPALAINSAAIETYLPEQLGWPASATAGVLASALHVQALPSLQQTAPGLSTSSTAAIVPGLPTVYYDSSGIGRAQEQTAPPIDVSIGSSQQFTIQTVNEGFQLYSATGRPVQLPISFAEFFAHVTHTGDLLGQPRVYFDQGIGEWILVVNELQVEQDGVHAGYFDIGVSTAENPAGGWHLYQLSTHMGAAQDCNWADDPQIGSDNAGIYLSGSSFGCGVTGTLRGAVLWDLPTQAFAHWTLASVFQWSGFTASNGEPLLTLTPASQTGTESNAWLVSDDAGYVANGKTSTHITVWAILHPANTGAPEIAKSTVALPYAYAVPPQAGECGDGTMETGDARITSAQYVSHHLVAALTSAVNWSDDSATRAAAYWIDLLPTISGGNTLAVQVEQANLFGALGEYTYYPSLVADPSGTFVLLVTVSAPGKCPFLAYTSRHATDPTGEMGHLQEELRIANDSLPLKTFYWGVYSAGCLSPPPQNGGAPYIWFTSIVTGANANAWQTHFWLLRTVGG